MEQKNALKISCFLNIIDGKRLEKPTEKSLEFTSKPSHKGQEEAFITTISSRFLH